MLEVFLVEQVVNGGGVGDAVGLAPQLYGGFRQAGPAAEVSVEVGYGVTEAASRARRSSRSTAASPAML